MSTGPKESAGRPLPGALDKNADFGFDSSQDTARMEHAPEDTPSSFDLGRLSGVASSTPSKAVSAGIESTASNKSRASSLQIGSVFGKCLLTNQLGQGTTGLVFRALHQTLNIPVAVKVLRSGKRDRQISDQLRSEARLLAQLNHPHVDRVLDFDEGSDLPYLVLEFVEGLSLAELIRQSGRLQLDQALRVIMQIAKGLDAAWQLGIIHRDVKPGNILLDKDGCAKLADLGQAAMAQHWLQGDLVGMADGVGTPAYMAPEQFQNSDNVDLRADIYALGATFYHTVTGRMPFTGKSMREVLLKHVLERPRPPHERVPGLPALVSDVILTMMAKNPQERYQNHRELSAALASLEIHAADQSGSCEIPRSALAKQSLHGSFATELFREGVAAARHGNKARASSLLRAVAELQPNNEPVWMWIGSLQLSPQSTIAAYERVLEINPLNARAAHELKAARLEAGIANLRSGDRQAARRFFQQVVAQDPACEEAWIALASIVGAQAEAMTALKEALRNNPDDLAARERLRQLE